MKNTARSSKIINKVYVTTRRFIQGNGNIAEGLSLNEDLERQLSELDEDIIKKEILTVVTETIEPALKQVQRELVLVVDYHPGMPISVSLSRKTNITQL